MVGSVDRGRSPAGRDRRTRPTIHSQLWLVSNALNRSTRYGHTSNRMYGVAMRPAPDSPTATNVPADLARLIGLPFDDSDDVIRAAIADASVPALLMSMVHMTGDMGLLERTAEAVHAHRDGPAGRHERAGQGRGARAGVRRDSRLPRPRLPAAVRPRRRPDAGDVRRDVRRRGHRGTRRLRRRGPAVQRRRPERTGADVDPGAAQRVPRRRHRVRRGRAAGRDQAQGGGHAVHDRREAIRASAGPGWRIAIRAAASTSPTSTTPTPSSRPTTGRTTTPNNPRSCSTSTTSRHATTSPPTFGSTPR